MKDVTRLHRPIMVQEILELLEVKPGGVYADLTFGEGGHAEEFLRRGASRVVGSDRDQDALDRYREVGEFKDDPRLVLRHGKMSTFAEDGPFDGMLVDLGVSTRQLLEPHRGFSFNGEGPLDMRMDRTETADLSVRLAQSTAEDLIPYLEAADIHPARKIANRVLWAWKENRLKTTVDLAKLIPGSGKRHPATQLFLALRMMVNEEMDEVGQGLPKLLPRLKVGGRLVVLTFHSTEDRLVKRTFYRLAGRCICDEPICRCSRVENIDLVTRKPRVPGESELRENPRSRSVKLRCVEKLRDGE
jgi:16S rRNA (cytosine1402-N4)-methyltransferase